MSRIVEGIEACLKGVQGSDQELFATFEFPDSFAGFDGHFPQQKVLPGACQIQCVVTALERHHGRRARLRNVSYAKFMSQIIPGETVNCRLECRPDDNGTLVCKAVFTKGEEKCSELKLAVSWDDGNAGGGGA